MWILWMFVPALVVFAVHLTIIALWQKAATWRVRRHVNRALTLGHEAELRHAASETARAQRDWLGRELWTLGKAIDITLRRARTA